MPDATSLSRSGGGESNERCAVDHRSIGLDMCRQSLVHSIESFKNFMRQEKPTRRGARALTSSDKFVCFAGQQPSIIIETTNWKNDEMPRHRRQCPPESMIHLNYSIGKLLLALEGNALHGQIIVPSCRKVWFQDPSNQNRPYGL